MPEPRKPNRYELPSTSMIGALLVVLALVGAFVAWRAVNRDNEATPVRTVQYDGWLAAGRDDGRLRMFAPSALPDGWRATSASYRAGAVAHWHLGLLTDEGQYVGVEEGLWPVGEQVRSLVDENARRGPDVRISGATWQVWTDSGGDYAVVRTLPAARQGDLDETLLVVGSAPPAQVRELAASLTARAGRG